MKDLIFFKNNGKANSEQIFKVIVGESTPTVGFIGYNSSAYTNLKEDFGSCTPMDFIDDLLPVPVKISAISQDPSYEDGASICLYHGHGLDLEYPYYLNVTRLDIDYTWQMEYMGSIHDYDGNYGAGYMPIGADTYMLTADDVGKTIEFKFKLSNE